MVGCKTDSMDKRWSKFWMMVEDRETWLVAVHGVANWNMTEQLNNNSIISNHLLLPFQKEFSLS